VLALLPQARLSRDLPLSCVARGHTVTERIAQGETENVHKQQDNRNERDEHEGDAQCPARPCLQRLYLFLAFSLSFVIARFRCVLAF
jgi:hypothetical protein